MRIKKNISFKRFVLGSCLILCCISVYAQKDDEYTALRKEYSNENAVFVSRKENVEIKIEKDQLVVYSKVYEELLLLTDKTSEYIDRNVYWSSFSEIQDLDARSLNPDGNHYKTMKVKEYAKTNEISEGTFYDDSRSYKFVFPGLVNGSRSILSYTEKLKDPHLFGHFYFTSFAPAKDVEYSVTFPSNVKIHYKLFHVSDSALQFTSKVSGKSTTYTWKMHNVKKFKVEDAAPAFSYFTPGIVVLIDQYTVDNQTIKVLADTNDLYNWYYGFVKYVNTSVSPNVKAVVDSLTNGATDNLDKVKRIFYWVQNQVTYIAYEDSLGGFIPREATLVCSRRFGDCKDMASTLTEMINAAGLEAHQTWIGTRDIPYTFEDVPAPISTNHMICTYIQDGKYYFLDATGKNSPFDFPTSMIQGKQALIGMGPDKYKIVRVPVLDTDKNIYSDSVHMQLNNTTVKGSGKLSVRGYNKILLGWRLQNVDKSYEHKYLTSLLEKGSNKFNLDSSSYENLTDRDKDLAINYSFSLSDYVQQNGNELYINMQLEKIFKNDLLDADREAPRDFEFKTIDRGISTLDVPKGYKISYLPQSTSYTGPLGGFKITYSVKGNEIIDDSYIYINTLMIYPKDFSEWNKMIRALSRAYNESVTLVKQ
jgi:transglutaminase-like putative cysteine protease